MAQTKFAQLHSGLLARKGEALPTSTHTLTEESYRDSAAPTKEAFPPIGSTLRKNLSPKAEERKSQNASCGTTIPLPRKIKKSINASPSDESVHKISVRLQAKQRHLLQLVSAITQNSQQDILGLALQDYFTKLSHGQLKNCGCFQKRLKPNSN
ncbi:MAG: hypothetical protein AAF603_00790 [Pseudomonadota bacterium]